MIAMIRAVTALLLCLLVLPFGMGLALCRNGKVSMTYFGGLTAGWTLFELLALLFHRMLWSLRVMTVLWLLLCVVAAIVGYFRGRKRLTPKDKAPGPAWTISQKLLLVLVLLVVAALTLNTVLRTYYGNWDDETYCSVAVTSWYTDTVYRGSTTAGTPVEAFSNIQYMIADWPVYSASLAVLSGLHPAIVYRTLMPLLLIPSSWWIGGATLQVIFRKDRTRTLMAMVLFQLLFLAAAEKMNGTGIEWWMVVNSWSGKAVGGGVILPMILWMIVELYHEPDGTARRECWKILFLTSCAGCLIAASLFFIVPVELAAWGAVYLLFTRRYREMTKLGACMLPPLVCAAATLL